MREPNFFEPTSLDEALALLSQFGKESRPLAGGTDLLLDVMHGRRQIPNVVSILKVPELDRLESNGQLQIGSTITIDQVHKSPMIRSHFAMLSEAAACIGSQQIRNLATIGGNICNALPCADTAPPLLAADAVAVLASAQGERLIPVEDFLIGQRATLIRPDELLVRFLLPLPAEHTGSAYLSFTPRRALDLTVIGVAAQVTLHPGTGTIETARVAVGNASVKAVRANAAEAALSGQRFSEDLLDEAGELAVQACSPRNSRLRGSAAYRCELIRVLVKRCLRSAYQRAGGQLEEQG